jgi:hypothetical protein
MLGSLTTADPNPHLPSLVNNVSNYVQHHLHEPARSFRFYRFTSPIAPLDELLSRRTWRVPVDRIAALKVDTEGFEGQVLTGARALLASQKPLVIAESAESNPLALRVLEECGYRRARRIDRQLAVSSGPVDAVNGIYIHPERFAEYRAMKLLVE